MRRLIALLLAGVALALGGCGTGAVDRAGQRQQTVPLSPKIQIIRSGGVAGVHDILSIDPDGRWTFTNGKASSATGRLDDAAMSRLHQLVTSTGLAGAAAQTGPGGSCADQFQYELHVGDQQYMFDDCHATPAPLGDLIALLHQSTPF